MENNWKNKSVLITGVCGTIGSELLRQLLDLEPKEIIGLDNNESELFFLSQLSREYDFVHFYMCDIRNKESLRRRFTNVDIVLHTAALKHVILNEYSPAEAVQTNIIGTQNIIEIAFECNVKRVLFTSSDKAVNPTNVMGTSKLMGERLMTAANAGKRSEFPVFSSTRFGNVLGSSGSVIPLFKKQILNGGPVTLTDAEMSRFVMTIPEASSLVMDSVFMSKGGEVFVTKMPTINIGDLAHAMVEVEEERGNVEKDSIEIKIIGAKPGEKLYEELINEEEIRRTIELDEFFSVLPAFKSLYEDISYDYGINSIKVDRIYRSDLEGKMTLPELKKYLLDNKLI